VLQTEMEVKALYQAQAEETKLDTSSLDSCVDWDTMTIVSEKRLQVATM
jgi:hypothetical protein